MTEIIDGWAIGIACYCAAYHNGPFSPKPRTKFSFDGNKPDMFTIVVKGQLSFAPLKMVTVVLCQMNMFKVGASYIEGPLCPSRVVEETPDDHCNLITPTLGSGLKGVDVEFLLRFDNGVYDPDVKETRIAVIIEKSRLARFECLLGMKTTPPPNVYHNYDNVVATRGESAMISFPSEEFNDYNGIRFVEPEEAIARTCDNLSVRGNCWRVASDMG